MKKIIILSILIAFSNVYSLGQNAPSDEFIIKPKFTSSFEIGSGFISSKSTKLFYNFVSPQINYNTGNRLVFNAGMIITNSNFSINASEIVGKTSGLNTYAFAGAKYVLTDKLTVNGRVMYPVNSFINSNQEKFNLNPKIYSFGADYKINDKFSIGVQVTNSQYNNYFPIYNGFLN